LYPKLESIAVVPLGLTAHRERLPKLREVTPQYARDFIRVCAKLQRRVQKRIGYPLVFPSDEFYLTAGLEPPAYEQYPEIPQLANGVGMQYKFYADFESLCAELPKRLAKPHRVAAITTRLGARVLDRLAESLNRRVDNLTLKLLPTTNTLFGDGITVTGLLPG